MVILWCHFQSIRNNKQTHTNLATRIDEWDPKRTFFLQREEQTKKVLLTKFPCVWRVYATKYSFVIKKNCPIFICRTGWVPEPAVMKKYAVSLWFKAAPHPWLACMVVRISMATDIITLAQMFPCEVTMAVELLWTCFGPSLTWSFVPETTREFSRELNNVLRFLVLSEIDEVFVFSFVLGCWSADASFWRTLRVGFLKTTQKRHQRLFWSLCAS